MVKCAWFRSKSFGFASSILALFSFCFRRGVVGNMSGFHPVASGSIPGSGFSFFVSCAPLAQSVERETSNLEAAGSTPARGLFCLYSSVAERSTCNAQVRNSILRAGFRLFMSR